MSTSGGGSSKRALLTCLRKQRFLQNCKLREADEIQIHTCISADVGISDQPVKMDDEKTDDNLAMEREDPSLQGYTRVYPFQTISQEVQTYGGDATSTNPLTDRARSSSLSLLPNPLGDGFGRGTCLPLTMVMLLVGRGFLLIQMAWGVLEDTRMAFPPGTIRLTSSDDVENGEQGPCMASSAPSEKHLKRRAGVVLHPQPSDSPDDPLNWSWQCKISHFLLLALGASLTNAASVMLTPGLIPLTEAFESEEKSVSLFTIGIVALWTTIGGHITVAGSDVWGRRPFYITSVGILALANLLASVTLTLPTLVIMRAVSGLASAPFLLLTPASVTDVFFSHERAAYLAVLVAVLNAGGQLGVVVSGYIVQAVGVSALFKLSAAAYAAFFVVAYFFLFETAHYERESVPSSSNQTSSINLKNPRDVFNDRMSQKSFIRGLLDPILLLVLPPVSYSVITFGVYLTLVISLPILVVEIIRGEPYGLSALEAGLACLPLAIITIIAGPLNGALMAVSARFMASNNGDSKGVFEPEFRLMTLLFCAPVTVGGLIGLSVSTTQQLPLQWVLSWLCVVFVYVVDCFPASTGQSFTLINLSAAMGIFIASDGLVTWSTTSGTSTVFDDLAALSAIILLPTVPICIMGKRIRSKLARMEWTRSLSA
ncbi:hypothetical protein L249_3179 [Ophiocordyceps polyrhachis-furcata BCC 54312]|uniref:Major facilitator superfamily (MFS) profile domain-containing protein n=1 Tax=Ophiocordyceps polyrhachis-furcata BCC 54312 TaxID=1330021 RepID=A0A367LS60_9HYPO|nr:hypothetical protein L249_3179 [Ophiocordyceps polyrhachis-furcata BCC 54312]